MDQFIANHPFLFTFTICFVAFATWGSVDSVAKALGRRKP